MFDRLNVRFGAVAAVLLVAGSACAWERPKLTRNESAQPVSRTWASVKESIANSIAKTGEGYFAYSRTFNDLGPIDTAGTLTDEELHTQFAMACILASPITVNGKTVKPQLAKWLADKMLMNVNDDKVARQGHVVAERDGTFVILKYLWGMNDANNAVAFYNPTDESRRMTVTARELGLTGTVKWTDRFDVTQKGSFERGFAFDVPAHGARLVSVNGKPVMRSEYRRECAVRETGGLVWRDVFVPCDGTYSILVGTDGKEPYRVKVNGLDQGEFRGAAYLKAALYKPENRIQVSGTGADGIAALYIARTDRMLDAVTTAYRLAHYGKDYVANQVYSKAKELPVGEMESTGPVEERALEWIHDVLWEWQFDWLWSRCAWAGGDKAAAIEHVEKGCFRFRVPYGIEPEDPDFWAYYKQLTGKDREKMEKKAEGKADPFDTGKGQVKKTLNAVEWQNANDKELAAAIADAELDKAVASSAAADALLAGVAGAYDTDPLLATKVAAVTARTMEPGRTAARRIWADALLKAATESKDDYRTMFFLEQLRWCGFRSQRDGVRKIGEKASAKGVKDFVEMLLRELVADFAASSREACAVRMLEGEHWWGGAAGFGTQMPFTAKTDLTIDLTAHNYNNVCDALMVSDRGRVIRAEKPMRITVSGGMIRMIGSGDAVLKETGGTLRDAVLYASRTWAPPSGKTPAELFFSAPQYNTWVELNYHQNQADVIKYAKDFLANGCPPGVLMIDDTWQMAYGEWEFDPRRFPDPKAMCDELHALGFKVMLWICPWVGMDTPAYRRVAFGSNPNDYRGYPTKGGFRMQKADPDYPAPNRWWNGYSALLDFTHPNARAWFKEQLDRLVRDYGIDGFKFDGGEFQHYTDDAFPTVDGLSRAEEAHAYAVHALDYTYSEYRNGWHLAGQPVVQRLIDKPHTWDAVRQLAPDMIAAGLMGYQFMCPDMAGGGVWTAFLPGAPIDQELFVRSVQVHALCGQMQFSASPWRFLDAAHQEAVRKAVKTRQRFAPYFVELAKACAKSGEPMIRNLEYAYPGAGYAAILDEFLLGDKLLVAPQMTANAASREVVIPSGEWIADDGTAVKGPAKVTVATPLERLPHFSRISR